MTTGHTVLDRLEEDFGWTPRQRQVLELLARDRSNAEIADTLGVSLDGAKWHVREVLTKLGVDSRDEAAEYWRAYNGWRLRFMRLARAALVGSGMKWLAAGVSVFALAAITGLVLLRDDARAPAPPTSPEPTSSPPDCPVPRQMVCSFGLELGSIIPDWDAFVAYAVDASSLDSAEGRAELRAAIAEAGLDQFASSARLVAVGCPWDTPALSPCDDGFGLTFSYLPVGLDPGPGAGGIIVLAYLHRADARPVLQSFRVVTDLLARRSALNGGSTTECNLAGSPADSDQPDCTRSEFVAYPEIPRQAQEINGVPVRAFAAAPSLPIPSEGALYVGAGCWGCDGGGTALWRASRDAASGAVRFESVSPRDWPSVDSIVVSNDGGLRIAAVVCDPGCFGIGEPHPATLSSLYLSIDGGVSWELVDRMAGQLAVMRFAGERILALWSPAVVEGDDWPISYYSFPGRQLLDGPPPPPGRELPDGTMVFVSPAGDALLREDGSLFWQPQLATSRYSPDLPVTVWLQPQTDLRFVSWSHRPGGGPGHDHQQPPIETFLAIYDGSTLERLYGTGDGRWGSVEVWLKDGAGLGTSILSDRQAGVPDSEAPDSARPRPVFVDYISGLIAPLEGEAFARQFPHGAAFPLALFPGPLLRVTDAGTCLNIREEPTASARLLRCLRDGVLLQDRGEAREADGITWLRVMTPGGEIGWASAEFLAR